MRTGWRIVALGLVTLWAGPPVHAGVYSTIEPKWELSGDYFRKFQEQSLTPLKQLATPEAQLPWQKNYYLAAMALLDAKDAPPRGQTGPFAAEQPLNFAACLLRIREPGKAMPDKAILILRAALDRDKTNFLVMSTLATAYQIKGEYRDASDLLSDARHYWATPFDQLRGEHKKFLEERLKWKKEDFDWFATCEKYQRQLLRLRFRELKKGPLTFAQAAERVDALFDPDPAPPEYKPLRFVGDSGKFEPGKVTAAEQAKLPADAIEIVEQLLVWMPDDLRLFWLLGELFNAKGDVESARTVFEEFLGKYSQTQEVVRLGRIDKEELFLKFVADYPEVGRRLKALREYVPPVPESPASTDPSKTKDTVNEIPDAKKAAEQSTVPLNLDWKALGIGLGGGTLAGFLIAWRLRDLLRRRG